ncbi:MAG: hypothetical protein R3F21_03220 [Myxococcota bacterium]
MRLSNRALFGVVALVGVLGVGTVASAASSVRCSVQRDGKTSIQQVESEAACTRLEGRVVHDKAGAHVERLPAKLRAPSVSHR